MFSERTNWKLTHNRFTQALDEVRAAGAMVHDLTASNPTRAGLHYDEAAIVKALALPLSLDYDPQPKGLRTAREAVVGYYTHAHGVHDLDPEQLVLTSSTRHRYPYFFPLRSNPVHHFLSPPPTSLLF